MATDIKLNDRFVEVEGNALKAKTWDFMLDSPDRRIQSTPEYRRALVHNVGDKLAVNYAGDYPGGVEIEGHTKIQDLEVAGVATIQLGITFEKLGMISNVLGIAAPRVEYTGSDGATISVLAQDLCLTNKPAEGANLPCRNVALSHMPGDKLVINHGKGYESGVTIEGDVEFADALSVKGKSSFADTLTIGSVRIEGGEAHPPSVFQLLPSKKELAIHSDTIVVTTTTRPLLAGQPESTLTLDLVETVEKLQEGKFSGGLTIGNVKIEGGEAHPPSVFEVRPPKKELAVYSDTIVVTTTNTFMTREGEKEGKSTLDLVDAVEKLLKRVTELEAQLVPHS